MYKILVVLVFVLCLVESYATVTDFLNNLPDDISNAVSTAWKNMMAAIRKPVRIKRLGRGGRKKNTNSRFKNTITNTTTTTTTTTTEATTFGSTHLMLKKLELPILPTPKWQNLEDWKNLQRPRFALKSGWPSSSTARIFYEVFESNNDSN